MESKFLKSQHIKLYKRENSEYWQMKIKFPKLKAIRFSTGTRILKDAKKIALKRFESLNKDGEVNFKKRSKNVYKKIHLVETADLNKKEIEYILKEANKFIDFNKKRIKKNNLLEGRTIFNLFFEDSTRTRTSFEVAAKRLGADLINVAVKDSSIATIEYLNIKKTSKCIDVYRKKQEFSGAIVNLKSVECNNGEIKKQKGSFINGYTL